MKQWSYARPRAVEEHDGKMDWLVRAYNRNRPRNAAEINADKINGPSEGTGHRRADMTTPRISLDEARRLWREQHCAPVTVTTWEDITDPDGTLPDATVVVSEPATLVMIPELTLGYTREELEADDDE